MTIQRVSFLGAHNASQLRLRQAYGRVDQVNQQVATGRAYLRPSESPSAASRAATLQQQLDEYASYDRSIDDARSRLSVADTKLNQAADIYGRITELTVQAASSTNDADARKAIREEVVQLRSELVSIANSQHLGASVFSGLANTDAVSQDLAGNWTFAGDPAETVSRRISSAESVDVSITAGEVFGDGTTDIFSTLDQLAADLDAGNTSGIQDTIATVNSLRSALLGGAARIGAAANRVEQAASRNSAVKISLTAELSNLQDVDMADAITNQNRLSVAYQAALGVTAKLSQQTLLDWLH